MIKLYDHPDCPFSQKVRVVLAEKELEYECLFVDLRAGAQRTPEFLKLNPYGKVPVLVDEDLVVYDSTIINEYLEDEYPEPPLMPEDSAGRARVRILEDYCDNSFLPVAGLVLADLAKPEAERDVERLKRYQSELQRGLGRLEPALEGTEYLVGGFSLADVAFAPRVLILPQLGIDLDPRLRNVAAWIDRLRQRPSVQALGL
ncbi:MAG TPA: glutathione S-transferase family protein [Candidatus Kryptonia bacterium]|nr:glutathione S-transferase family protein [Candidatus Kryptonia bacterium]